MSTEKKTVSYVVPEERSVMTTIGQETSRLKKRQPEERQSKPLLSQETLEMEAPLEGEFEGLLTSESPVESHEDLLENEAQVEDCANETPGTTEGKGLLENFALDDILLLGLIFLLVEEGWYDDRLFIFLVWLFLDGLQTG